MPHNEITLSKNFKRQASKSIFSIILFILVYVFMLALAVGLCVICIYGCIMIFVAKPHIMAILFGLGLASLGILVLIFLVKFIFASNKIDRSHLMEINKREEPELFKLIEEIVKKVDTKFPKKVYLSTDVNAAVFYDSNFWSMFLPIRKNLQIGLGLVNTVSKQELTAILSHEFGHFSQKSMKVGSYVYNVNQIIFNMLYSNDSYSKLIHGWSNISGIFAFFVVVAVKIIEGVQYVLRGMYGIVNRSYMGLSREMEFHADEIASTVTGYEPLKNSLLRMSLADHSFNNTLSFYENKIVDNKKSENLYKEQSFVMNFIANDTEIEIVNNLPQLSGQEFSRFNKSKLVVKDQWASHPSVEDRIESLEKTGNTTTKLDHTSANTIFTDIEATQRKLTKKIFKEVQYKEDTSFIPFTEFKSQYKEQYQKNLFPKIFNSYYDNKNPIPFDLSENNFNSEDLKFESLFSDDSVDLVISQSSLESDMETLKLIAEKSIPIKTFDYDGKKYNQRDCKKLLTLLEKESSQLNEAIKTNDIKIYRYFKHIAKSKNKDSKLDKLYSDFFKYDRMFKNKMELYTKLTSALEFVNVTTPHEQILINFQQLSPLEEELKADIRRILNEDLYQQELTQEIKDNLEKYCSTTLKYFGNESYYENNLNTLYDAINSYGFLLSRGYFILKKKVLDFQE